jgi:hypothetical protein
MHKNETPTSIHEQLLAVDGEDTVDVSTLYRTSCGGKIKREWWIFI